MTTTTTTDTATAVAPILGTEVASRVEQACARCGGTDVTMEAAVRWDINSQEWQVSAVYDNSAYCGGCSADVSVDERELAPTPALATYTVFVRQANG